MKQSRFTDGQIIAILKQAESGMPVPECAESTASALPLFTNGDRSTQGWMLH